MGERIMLSQDLKNLATSVRALKDSGDRIEAGHLEFIAQRLVAYACDAHHLQNAVLVPQAMGQRCGNVIPFAPVERRG
jgi:hypothetical protein